ncbi:hypothetical protein Tco_1043592 [Tanacetum coccineum]|uniref:Uncharacterized protein n=1 Tax=Tanacetum coccineum TaxID=301880 RepID=A0ABQ5GPP0_9ASTR
MSITSSNLHKSSEDEDSTLPNYDTNEVPSNKSQRNTTDPSAVVSDSPAYDYDLADESSVCSTPLLLPLKKLDGAEHGSGPKTVKSILKSKFAFKAETLKGITLNKPSSALARGNKSSSTFKTNSALVGKLKNVKVEDDPPLAMVMKELNELKLQISKKKRGINPRNPQHVIKNYETCGSNVHTTSDHNDIEWFRKRETPHAKKAESSNALRSKTPTKRKPFTKSPNMYQEYLAEFWYSAKALENSKVSFSIPTSGIYGEVGLNTVRNTIDAHYLPCSNEYVAPPSIDVVRKWFSTIGYGEEISIKGTLRKSLLPPSVNNWALKPNQLEEPLFTAHMLAICALDKPVVFKAPKTSSRAESVSQGAKPGAKTGHRKPTTSSTQPFVSSKEATKATGGPTSLGVISEERANPQLSSSMSALNLNKPIFSASFIIHSESASGHDVSANFIAEADPGLSAPNDSIPPQQGMDKGTKNTSFDHIFADTDPHVLADQIKSVSEGLETVLTQPTIEKGASSTAIHGDKEEAFTAIHDDKEEASNTIKLEDLAKLLSQIQPSFKDLNSPEDDLVIIIDESDEDKPNAETEDSLVPRSLIGNRYFLD